ncbi:MAG: aspartate/glutamate racemase family protein [Alphaproteobacteria bacterium]|nr:aspartate/glutamate racemase family protein [Alphaproteobacteria bacterium]
MAETREGRCFGLVGGLGVGATVYYYRALAAAHAARGLTMRALIAHADVARVLGAVKDKDVAGLTDYLAGLVDGLARGGAQVAAIGAIAPHIAVPELAKRSPIPVVDLVEETARVVRERGFKRVALFGTRFAIESGLFGRLSGVEVVRPKPGEVDFIHDTYVRIVAAERGDPGDRESFRHLARVFLARDGVDAIVLAGTELALIFDEKNAGFPAVDCARVHVDAIMARVAG